jgi:hypothetical protein
MENKTKNFSEMNGKEILAKWDEIRNKRDMSEKGWQELFEIEVELKKRSLLKPAFYSFDR